MPFDFSALDFGFIGIQLIGFVAMGLGIGSYQARRRSSILTIQIFSSALWCLQFALLAGWSGLINNALGLVRNAVYTQKERWGWVRTPLAPLAFILLVIAAGVFSFTLEGPISLLPMAAMIIQTVAYSITNERTIRICSLFVSPLWLVYDAITFSAAGVVCEALTICSIIIALIRFHQKPKGERT